MDTRTCSRRGFLKISGTSVAGAAALAACGGAPASPTATATTAPAPGAAPTTRAAGSRTGAGIGDPEVKNLSFAMNNPNYATQAPYYIAREMGFFKQQGFTDVKIDTLDDTFQAVITGSHTFANVDLDKLILSFQQGVKVRAVGVNRDHEYVIVALAPGIKKPEDLKGKKAILYTPGTRNWQVRIDVLKQWGLQNADKDLQFVELSGGADAWNQALLAGQVQVATQTPRHIESVLKAGGTVLPIRFLEAPQEVLATSADFVAKNPNTVANMWIALLKARAVWMDPRRKDEIITLMKKFDFNIPPEFVKAYYSSPEVYSPNAGFRMQSMHDFVREMVDAKLIPKMIDYKEFTDLTGLYAAQSTLGMPLWPPASDESLSAVSGL